MSESIRVDAVSLIRGGRLIIDNIDCTAPAGSVTAIVGPNGAGKSTLLQVIAHIDRPDDGHVYVAGQAIAQLSRRDRARRIALVEQQSDTEIELRVLDAVLLGRTPHLPMLAGISAEDEHIAHGSLAAVAAAHLAQRNFHTLSGGERQRVALARALTQDPDILLLDEPTNHLDIGTGLLVFELLRDLATAGLTVIVVVHDLNLAAAYADHVIVLDNSRVMAAGEPRRVLTAELISRLYEVQADVVDHPRNGHPVIVFGSRSRPPSGQSRPASRLGSQRPTTPEFPG